MGDLGPIALNKRGAKQWKEDGNNWERKSEERN